jgi:hypothetical protein
MNTKQTPKTKPISIEVLKRYDEQTKAYGGQLRGDALLHYIGFFDKQS